MNIINNYLKKYAFFIFLFLTFFITIVRTPFWDETHSLEVAMCSLKEIFYLARIEVHPILWFLILKPFSNMNLYPYAMYLINWLFCAGSIYLLFKTKQFSYVTKSLIAFSTPFLLYFATVSRCYSAGIFFVFLICTYFPLRFKKPVLYALLIVLASQVNIMTMIGVFYLGLIYLYELWVRVNKNISPKKDLYIVFLVFLAALIFTVFEFIGLQSHGDILVFYALKDIFDFIVIPNANNILSLLLRYSFMLILYPLPYFLFKYSKKGLFFIFFTFLTMTLMFILVNKANYWNYYFYFVYLIVLFWTYGKKITKIKFIKYVSAFALFLMLCPYSVQNGSFTYVYTSYSKKVADYILSKDEYKNTKLYSLDWWSDVTPGADIYLKRKGIKIYNRNNIERGSFEDLKTIFRQRYQPIDFDEFMSKTPDKFYILSDGSIVNQKYKNCTIEKNNDKGLIITTFKNKYYLQCIEDNKNAKLLIYRVIKL